MNWKDKNHYTDLPAELQQQIKTERQWAMAGYLPKEGATGKEMYPNWNHNAKYKYYHEKEVRPATRDELSDYFAPEKAHRRELARQRKEKYEKEVQKAWDQLYSDVHRLECEMDWSRVAYHELCKQITAHCENAGVLPSRTIVLDIETTGLEPEYDEILQLSILDADTSDILYNHYFQPFLISEWAEAQAINHISPEMVKDEPFFASEVLAIQKILNTAKSIVGYNPAFDIGFLKSYGLVCNQELIDVMLMFASYNGERDELHGGYRWKKLTECAAALGYVWDQRGAHDSLADCAATLFSYKKLCE